MAKPKNHQKSKSETITVERNVIVKGTNIRVKSVFDGNIPLEKALSNLAGRRISESKTA